MPEAMKRFVLYGNGPMSNRGCEAIVLGTRRILESEYGPIRITLASLAGESADGLPDRVDSLPLGFGPRRFSPDWFRCRLRRALGLGPGRPHPGFLRRFRRCLAGAELGMSVGGDGYAIDWGHAIVDRLLLLDDCCRRAGLPVVIWGASVGPFDAEPGFEARVADHLRAVDLVLVREPRSFEYLRRLGVEHNLCLAPDPAFALEPEPGPLPDDCGRLLAQGCIGLNLSPLPARVVTGGDQERWQEIALGLVRRLLVETGMPILLVPHVIHPQQRREADDEVLMQAVRARLDDQGRAQTAILPRSLGAARLKDCIGRTRLFIGARMHATIAALSSGVPTLSLAYSRKAWGVNELVYGHNDWVLPPAEIDPAALAARVAALALREDIIRAQLRAQVPFLVRQALTAGRLLAKALAVRSRSETIMSAKRPGTRSSANPDLRLEICRIGAGKRLPSLVAG